MVEGDFTTVKKRTIETDIAHNMVRKKTTNGTVVSQVSYVLDQNLAPLSRKFPELIPEESLTNVHPLVKNLFTEKIPNLQLAGRLAHFSKNWEKLTQDQEILSVVKGYVIPFFKISVKRTIPKEVATSKTQELLMDQEITKMLDKGAISKVEHQFPGQFLINILLVKKKDGGNRPCINLKALSKFIPYKHFKMEGLHCLKYLLQKNDFLCKIELKKTKSCCKGFLFTYE